MTSDTELRDAIGLFYDQYHRKRVRRPNEWMKSIYWPQLEGKILEVGAGTLWPIDKEKYTILDLSSESILRGRKAGFEGLIADGSNLPFKNESFDTVACYDVLEHIINPSLLICEMCRVSRNRVVIAGPNFINGRTSGMNRYLLFNFFSFIFGKGKHPQQIIKPHLSFDENWKPDRDAIFATNAGWVADEIKRNSRRIQTLRTWDLRFPWLNLIPGVRCLGTFMFVVGEK